MSIAGGAATNIAPNYVSGAMLANDNEFYLYGYVPVCFGLKRMLTFNWMATGV